MDLKSTLQWLTWIATITTSALLMYFVNQIDQIVNGDLPGQLYYYGLQNSPNWYDPFHSIITIIFTCLGVIIVLSGFSLVFGLKVNKKEDQSPAKPKQPLVQSQPVTPAAEEPDTNKMYNSCPHCKKTFSKPIVMLNFEGGKTKLLNVCPHCSRTLGNA